MGAAGRSKPTCAWQGSKLIETQQARLDHYMALPYTILLKQDVDDGGWLAKIVELPGCMTVGESQTDVLEMIEDAKLTWLSGSIIAGDVIPEPQPIHA